MKNTFAGLFLLFGLVVLAAPAYSQGGGGGDQEANENIYLDRAQKRVFDPEKRQVDAASGGNSRDLVLPNPEVPWAGFEATEDEPTENGGGGGGGEGGKTRIDPETKHTFVNTAPAFINQLSWLHSEGYQKGLNTGIKGPIALWHIAMAQTEPALEAGASHALQESLAYIGNKYQEEQALYNQLPSNPGARQMALNAYFTCVAKEMGAEGGKGNRNGQAKSPLEASDICIGQSAEQPQDAQKKVTAEEEKVYKAEDNTHSKEFTGAGGGGGGGGGGNDKETVSVVDELFNPLEADDKVKNKQDVKKLKEHFLKYFGNFKIRLKKPKKVGTGFPTRGIEIGGEEIKPEVRAGKYLQKLTYNRYKDIVELLKAQCEHYNNPGGTLGELKRADELEFWANKAAQGENAKKLRKASLPSRPLQAGLGTAFFDIIRYRLEARQSGGGGGGGQGGASLQCDVIDLNNKFKPQGLKLKDDFYNEVIMIWNYAKILAVEQMLSMYDEAFEFINERTSESKEEHTRQAAQRLVLSAGRFNNLDEYQMVKNSNHVQAELFTEHVFDTRAKVIGTLGRAVTSLPGNKTVDQAGGIK